MIQQLVSQSSICVDVGKFTEVSVMEAEGMYVLYLIYLVYE